MISIFSILETLVWIARPGADGGLREYFFLFLFRGFHLIAMVSLALIICREGMVKLIVDSKAILNQVYLTYGSFLSSFPRAQAP